MFASVVWAIAVPSACINCKVTDKILIREINRAEIIFLLSREAQKKCCVPLFMMSCRGGCFHVFENGQAFPYGLNGFDCHHAVAFVFDHHFSWIGCGIVQYLAESGALVIRAFDVRHQVEDHFLLP